MKRLSLCLLLAACARSETPSPDTTSVVAPATLATPPRSIQARANDCPATGKWALCSVEKRLKRSGFVAKKLEGEAPERAGFSVRPAVYTTERGRLEVFLYEDEAALEKDVARLDTVAVAPRGSQPVWPSPPGFIRSGNLAVVYMGQTARQAERLTLALTAGAPSGG